MTLNFLSHILKKIVAQNRVLKMLTNGFEIFSSLAWSAFTSLKCTHLKCFLKEKFNFCSTVYWKEYEKKTFSPPWGTKFSLHCFRCLSNFLKHSRLDQAWRCFVLITCYYNYNYKKILRKYLYDAQVVYLPSSCRINEKIPN